jgi:acetolactate synthase-1/2/3 large subunit
VTEHYDGGELMIAAFNALETDYVFCSSGSEWAPVWEAFARRAADGRPAPTYLDIWHETVAVAMATGYGLVTRRVQAVLLHTVPGLLQGGMAVHGALLAGVGMVVTSSESNTYGEGDGPDPGGQWYRNLSFVGGPHTVAAPFTKWANQVGSVHTLYRMTTRAGELAARAPAGPVYLNVPLEVLLDPVEPPQDEHPVAPRGSRVSAPDDVEGVARLLATAKRPIIVTETGGREDGGFEALRALADDLGVGVVEPNSTVAANYATDGPMHLGSETAQVVADADLVLLVNCRVPFYPPSARPTTAPIVVIDEVPQRPHVVYQVLDAQHYLEGGVPATLDALRAAVLDIADARVIAERRAAFEAEHARYAAATRDLEAKAMDAPGIDPVRLATLLREIVRRDDATVVDETITHGRVVQRHVGWTAPDRYFYVQGGLGQGIPVALGVKLATPERPVIFTIGDGAFLYNPIVQALQTSKDLGLPILIVIFNNKKYLSMKMNHLRFYPDGAAVQNDNFLGVDLSTQAELSAFAEPFGMFHEAVSDPANLEAALDRALASVKAGTTAVLNVSVSR